MYFPDTNFDESISPIDALRIINELNGSRVSAEGEIAPTATLIGVAVDDIRFASTMRGGQTGCTLGLADQPSRRVKAIDASALIDSHVANGTQLIQRSVTRQSNRNVLDAALADWLDDDLPDASAALGALLDEFE